MTITLPSWVHIEHRHTAFAAASDEANQPPQHLQRHALNLIVGEVAVHHHRPLMTTLGSCIAVCLFDPQRKLIGMNHFLVPLRHSKDEEEGYFSGMTSMEMLVNAMMKAGARKDHLVAKAFGGGDMFGLQSHTQVGERNIEFTQAWLAQDGIELVASDWGGHWARKIIADPRSGDVFCRRIVAQQARLRALALAEQAFAERLLREQQGPRIEYFD